MTYTPLLYPEPLRLQLVARARLTAKQARPQRRESTWLGENTPLKALHMNLTDVLLLA